MNWGLSNTDIETIFQILKKYPEISTVILFGSRAKGTHKTASDIDLAIMDEGIDIITLARIKSELEDSSLPYFVDILHYPSIEHKDLKEHIDRVGTLFYKK